MGRMQDGTHQRHSRNVVRYVAIVWLSVCGGLVQAGDWREFRGPDGQGQYQGKPLPTEWGPDKNITWKTPLPGLGWSSPILVGRQLLLTTAIADEATPPNHSLRVLAVDADHGKLLWDRELFQEDGRTAPKPHKKNSHASPTPVSDGQRVWVHFGHMGTACLTLNGDVLWKTQELSYNPVHGNGASPILFEDLLIVSCDGNEDPFVVALEQGTGKVRWKTLRKTGARLPFSFATCQIITVNGETQLISPAADYCLGYNPRTGEELWRVKYPQPGWSLICRPVYAHGLLYIGTGYINQHLIAFRPEGRGDLTKNIVWQTRRYAPNTPTPIVVGDELYMISDMGFLSCLDAKTGQLHYAERLAGKGYSASPIVSDGKLWITSEEGIGQVVALGREFKVLARNDLGERTFASFVPDHGKLYVRSDSHLYCFEAK